MGSVLVGFESNKTSIVIRKRLGKYQEILGISKDGFHKKIILQKIQKKRCFYRKFMQM
jgi:hypothetical protein